VARLMTASPAELALLAAFLVTFMHFMMMGAQTFRWSDGDELAAGAAQLSFVVTGAIASMYLARDYVIDTVNGIGAAALLMAALALYEWARRTVRGRGFHIAWSGDVPGELCAAGPYRVIRHPFYLSYMLTFLALLIALPRWPAVAIFLFNVALFTHAALNDERSIAASPLADGYVGYKRQAGMFLPRFRRSRG